MVDFILWIIYLVLFMKWKIGLLFSDWKTSVGIEENINIAAFLPKGNGPICCYGGYHNGKNCSIKILWNIKYYDNLFLGAMNVEAFYLQFHSLVLY